MHRAKNGKLGHLLYLLWDVIWWFYAQFDNCDYCHRWRLSERMKEYYGVILCVRCYKEQRQQAERHREINALSADRGGQR